MVGTIIQILENFKNWDICSLANCSNSRVAGFQEMIREAGSDFREVIPGQQNSMWKNGKNIY